MRSPARPRLRASATGVSGARCAQQDVARLGQLRRAAAPSADCRARRRNRRRRGLEPAPIAGHGVSRSDSEIAQKSWPSGAPARAAAACSAETPGTTAISTRRQSRRASRSISSKTSARQPVDAGIARRDQRHRSGRRRRDRARAAPAPPRRRARSSCRVLPAIAGAEQIEIEAVADDVARRGERALASAVRQAGSPGPMPMIASRPRAPADRRRIERRGARAMAQVARARLALGDDQRASRADGGERRALGDALAAGRRGTPPRTASAAAASRRAARARRRTAPARRAVRRARGAPARPS